MSEVKDRASERRKVDRAIEDLRRQEEEMLRRAVVDLRRAEMAYVQSYEAWIHGPPKELEARLFALREAERRVDAARSAASHWEAASRQGPRLP